MNKPKCQDHDYINFLVADCSHTDGPSHPAHDAYTRLLQRLPSDSEALWTEVKGCIDPARGLLIIDDTTLDKPYASTSARHTRFGREKRMRGSMVLT